MSTCVDCGNTGMVSVPHPDYVQAGDWNEHHKNHHGEPIHYTAAVFCVCARGRQGKEADDKAAGLHGKKRMTLTQYRARVDSHPERMTARILYQQRERRGILPPGTGLFKEEDVREFTAQFGEVPL